MSDPVRDEPSTEELVHRIRSLSRSGRRDAFLLLLRGTDPADLAEALPDLDPALIQQIFTLLEPGEAGEVLAEADAASRSEVLDNVEPERIADVLEEMEVDDAADTLGDADPTDAEEILRLMANAESEGVRTILQYPEDSAGGLMNLDYAWLRDDMTVDQAIHMLRSLTPDYEPVEIHVVDARRLLVGTVPIRRLLTRAPSTRIHDIMETDLHPVPPETDQEEVARLFAKYDLIVMPVVDAQARLIGEITIDDVVDVIQQEASEDIYRMAGTNEDEAERGSVLQAARSRLPWLLVLLFGELLCGLVIAAFSVTLEEAIALVSFVPVLMALGGAAGQQGATVMVRALATRRMSGYAVRRFIAKEIWANIVLGCVMGVILGAVALAWTRDPWIANAVGIAAFLNVGKNGFMSSSLPLLFRRVGIDPAISTGPVIATLNDILGVVIYLLLASAAIAINP